ncbi:MAG: serine hydroxymethyltransferase [Actinobacteria bacterium]|nr:serine hydroxymethyltransferase [Cyanobacteriota bacterium]MCL5770753.1 serine hydroxymethyltransferase [Actinomycetota bacterium]
MYNLLSPVLSNKPDKEVEDIIKKEIDRQNQNITLIASENYASPAVLDVMGSVFTNKYAEGYPKHRYYEGCEYVDEIETLARNRLNELFNAEYSNVQPHSGVQANTAVYLAILKPHDKILSMNLKDGGHLSHGNVMNISGRYYEVHFYNVDKETEQIDYEVIRKMAKEIRPKLIIAGASSYPRIIDFKKFKEIADETGAYLMADIAHIAGLVAGEMHPTSVGLADFTTGTTHKTLRGPRGGFIIADKKYATLLDTGIFPGTQGGPLVHMIAAKAVSFKEALEPSFKKYAKNVIENTKILCDYLKNDGFRIVSGGTDNHLFLVDLTSLDMTGQDASTTLASLNIVLNKNVIPYDKLNPNLTSGIRIGAAAATSRGMGKEEMLKIGEWISFVLKNWQNKTKIAPIKAKARELAEDFPVYTY